MEQWKDVSYGDGKYSVSDKGMVKNNITGKLIKSQIQNSGYHLAHLHHNNKRKAFLVHRLVAIAFIPMPDGKDIVDHKDGNKLNNEAKNLRWVDAFENMRNASNLGLLANAAKKASVRMALVGKKYGFDNSQQHLKAAKPCTILINGVSIAFRSIRQASIHFKIDHKTLTRRIKQGLYICIPDPKPGDIQ